MQDARKKIYEEYKAGVRFKDLVHGIKWVSKVKDFSDVRINSSDEIYIPVEPSSERGNKTVRVFDEDMFGDKCFAEILPKEYQTAGHAAGHQG